jgi:hypothetical protein
VFLTSTNLADAKDAESRLRSKRRGVISTGAAAYRLVQEVVEEGVVAENNVSAHVEEEALWCDVRAG